MMWEQQDFSFSFLKNAASLRMVPCKCLAIQRGSISMASLQRRRPQGLMQSSILKCVSAIEGCLNKLPRWGVSVIRSGRSSFRTQIGVNTTAGTTIVYERSSDVLTPKEFLPRDLASSHECCHFRISRVSCGGVESGCFQSQTTSRSGYSSWFLARYDNQALRLPDFHLARFLQSSRGQRSVRHL